jgi:hypothetical protein
MFLGKDLGKYFSQFFAQYKLSGFSNFTKNNSKYLGDSIIHIIVSITQSKNCLAEKYSLKVLENI